jgi:hypothetical protein
MQKRNTNMQQCNSATAQYGTVTHKVRSTACGHAPPAESTASDALQRDGCKYHAPLCTQPLRELARSVAAEETLDDDHCMHTQSQP